jgi:hypothetical protein
MTDVLASAADGAYGYHLLNLIGSVKQNSDVFDRVDVFDLGLTEHQRRLLDAVEGVVVREVPPFVPHWAQCFTWKPWAWMQLEADRVFWLDAGATVLRSLGPALEQIGLLGYFVVSQGNELQQIVPPDYFERFELPREYERRPYVAAGILGFVPGGDFFRRVLVPTYEDCLGGANLGYSADEVQAKNRGLAYTDRPLIRSCSHFRWDQTLLNIHLCKELPNAAAADLDEYAGWRSARDHPRQVIWSHRRGGSLRYLKRIRYSGRGAPRARAFGAWYQLRWWWKLRGRLFRPSAYLWKARKTLRTALR